MLSMVDALRDIGRNMLPSCSTPFTNGPPNCPPLGVVRGVVHGVFDILPPADLNNGVLIEDDLLDVADEPAPDEADDRAPSES